MLIAARSSHDFACCLRATASARSKYASAFAAWRSAMDSNHQYGFQHHAACTALRTRLWKSPDPRYRTIDASKSVEDAG
jgi:hypothetical protein